MRRFLALFLVLMVVLAGARIIYWAGQGEGENVPQDVLRLHIIANSNAPRDQEIKLAVRDAILSVLSPGLAKANSAAEACRLVGQQINYITWTVQKELERQGEEQPVAVRLGRTYFPTRQYDGITFPAGEYQALQIFIGEGEGANWWCVLFPPLCLVDGTTAEAAEGQGEGEKGSLSSIPEIRFKIVEWFRSLTEEKVG